ncbi:MAG: exodeoxyribonuclease VII small subunit [Clostridiales bacterium]|nr:exodeoxyribonuclease VII small subunit [Clostridiales bacterium]
MTIDENLEQLDKIVREMEQGNQSLEEALASFEAGIKLVKKCSSQLDRVEKKIKILSESGEMGE